MFGIVYIFAMLLSLCVLSWKTIEKEDQIPIIQESIPSSYTGQTNQDVLNQWLEGKEYVKTDYVEPEKVEPQEEIEEKPEDNKLPPDQKPVSAAPSVTDKSKPSTDGDSSDSSDESEESEESDNEPDPDEYAKSRNIPKADVNLDELGFRSGMSALKEAQIQQYRQFEKSGQISK